MKKNSDDKPATPDILWKELIRNFFKDFVAFFKPDLLPEIWVEKTEFLENELNEITAKQKKGIVDVLTRVYLRNGEVEYLLFHVEIQGYSQENFQERMFDYFARIWLRFRKPVVSLAVLTYKPSKSKAHNFYGFEAFGTTLHYQYNIFQTRQLEYESCLGSANCVEVALGILAPVKTVPLWQRKIEVIRKLIDLGYSPAQAHLLISFVDRLSPLKRSESEQFKKCIQEEKEEIKMIMTSWEESSFNKGIEKGKVDSLLKIMKMKFGKFPENLPPKLENVKNLEKLDELLRVAVQVDNLEKMLAEIEKINLN
jgi:hypothetical protein